MKAPEEKNLITCAICADSTGYKVLYPERLNNPDNIDFSSRKMPTKTHARIVKCKKCGLIFSNPFFSQEYISQLYKGLQYHNEPQVENYLKDYFEQLKKAIPLLDSNNNLLEIGCGNGFFLRETRRFGFKNIVGVEPSKEAISQADPEIRDKIICDEFKDGLFQENTFDIVCVMQVLDHILEPNYFLQNIHKVLKPGGLVFFINHNIRFLANYLVGENSPMFAPAHIYLFDTKTIRMLIEKNNFDFIYSHNILNYYTLEYAVRMFPIPGLLKKMIRQNLMRFSIGNLQLRLPAGNMATLARKPYLKTI